MRIRFLLNDVHVKGGGVLTVTLGLAEALAADHDVELVSVFGRGTRPVHRIPESVTVTTLIPERDERGRSPRARLRRLLESRPSRLVPAWDPRAGQWSLYSDLVLWRYLKTLRGGALVTMQPGLTVAFARAGGRGYLRVAQEHRPLKGRSQAFREALRTHAGRLDAFLALTDADVRGYRRLLGRRTRVRKMSNGNPVYDLQPSSLDRPVVVAAGRLEKSKGFDLLVQAWERVAAKHPEWRLEIYGKGSLHEALQQQIDRAGLAATVTLMGFTDELPKRMAASSLVVLSSRAEGYGMVLVEGMACGVPVVATDCPTGPREIITHGVDGLLVPNKDVDAIADAIITMIELPLEERRRMGRAALEKARSRSHQVIAAQWVSLFEELAAKKRR